MNCPYCKGKLIRIIYGLPDPMTMEQVENGELYLSGCTIEDYQPSYCCNTCKREFDDKFKLMMENNIELIKGSSVEQEVDAIVNAANKYLMAGSGVCGAIFAKAGREDLQAACDKYERPLNDGDAVITPAFKIDNCKFIIHAIGPDFGRTPEAFDKLFLAYYNSLLLLKENNLHSISFPLISSGIYGGRLNNPVRESVKQGIKAYEKFIKEFKDYEIKVKLCAYSDNEMIEAQKEFDNNYTKV